MPQSVVSILNPQSAEAMAVTLNRRAFLRELALALLVSLTLPLVCLPGLYVFLNTPGANLLGVAIGTITAAAVVAVPLLLYAALRLNAATLARERAARPAAPPLVHPPMAGPLLLRRSIVAGSIRSRILAGFPACVGFALVFAILSYVTTGSVVMALHVPLAALLSVQAVVAADLLR